MKCSIVCKHQPLFLTGMGATTVHPHLTGSKRTAAIISAAQHATQSRTPSCRHHIISSFATAAQQRSVVFSYAASLLCQLSIAKLTVNFRHRHVAAASGCSLFAVASS